MFQVQSRPLLQQCRRDRNTPSLPTVVFKKRRVEVRQSRNFYSRSYRWKINSRSTFTPKPIASE